VWVVTKAHSNARISHIPRSCVLLSVFALSETLTSFRSSYYKNLNRFGTNLALSCDVKLVKYIAHVLFHSPRIHFPYSIAIRQGPCNPKYDNILVPDDAIGRNTPHRSNSANPRGSQLTKKCVFSEILSNEICHLYIQIIYISSIYMGNYSKLASTITRPYFNSQYKYISPEISQNFHERFFNSIATAWTRNFESTKQENVLRHWISSRQMKYL